MSAVTENSLTWFYNIIKVLLFENLLLNEYREGSYAPWTIKTRKLEVATSRPLDKTELPVLCLNPGNAGRSLS